MGLENTKVNAISDGKTILIPGIVDILSVQGNSFWKILQFGGPLVLNPATIF